MRVKRIVANIAASDIKQAERFYKHALGLDIVMNHGWISTYASSEQAVVQLSIASQGGSGTSVPDLSIEVDDLDAALSAMEREGFPAEYGPVEEPWGVRRFYVRDPFGKLINILSHL
ncbi:glyoxalase [Paenibacillaceae bacterium]|nr:glyoxalase [Paenibacillaceae bacterium]